MDSNVSSFPRAAERRSSTGLYTRYLRLVKASRLLNVTFWTLTAFFLFWAIPWLPGGLSEEDYNRQVAFTLALAGIAFGTGVAVLLLREWQRRLEEALVAFNAVYDNTTGLYNRRYFYDRLALECERAQRQGTPFSVLLFRFDPDTVEHKRGGAETTLRLLGDMLVRETRGSDVVAVLGANELAVAAVGVDGRAASDIGQRLRLAIEKLLTERLGAHLSHPVRLGVSWYPGEGSNAAALLRLARESMDEPREDRSGTPESGEEAAA